jgi:hypothetical protein
MPRESDEHDHCWHPTGVGYSHGTGGGEQQMCCHCGARHDRRWRIVSQPAAGHGRFFMHNVKVYDDEVETPNA